MAWEQSDNKQSSSLKYKENERVNVRLSHWKHEAQGFSRKDGAGYRVTDQWRKRFRYSKTKVSARNIIVEKEIKLASIWTYWIKEEIRWFNYGERCFWAIDAWPKVIIRANYSEVKEWTQRVNTTIS